MGKKNANARKSNVKSKKTNKKAPKKMVNVEKDKLTVKNPDSAGIDIGSEEHWVSVPPDRVPSGEEHARPFGVYTDDLRDIIKWLHECGIKTVALESTRVYWIPLFKLLETHDFEVCLVNTKHMKNVSGRPKTDRLDCVWLMRLHSYGLLSPSFRPSDDICVLRSYTRSHKTLVEDSSDQIRRMGKAFQQMNVRLDKAVTDMTGKTGTLIIKAVLAGERDPSRLAALRDRRCKKSEEEILRALSGDFREEHVYALGIAHRMYNSIQAEIELCEAEISKRLRKLVPTTAALRAAYSKIVESEGEHEEKSATEMAEMVVTKLLPDSNCDRKTYLKGLLGVDATAIPGVDVKTVTVLLSEVGLDFSKWENSARFASWLGLAPCVKKSGISKNLRHHTKKVQSRAAEALRMAASSVIGTDTHLGDFYWRVKSRQGSAAAITATARKMAVTFFEMVTKQREFVEIGPGYRQKRNPAKYVAKARRQLMELGYKIVPLEKPEETEKDMAAEA